MVFTSIVIDNLIAQIMPRSMCGDPTAGNALGMYVVAAVVVGGTKMSGGRGNVLFNIMGIFVIGIRMISTSLAIRSSRSAICFWAFSWPSVTMIWQSGKRAATSSS